MTARLCQKTTGSTPWWLGMKDQTMPALNFHTTFRSSNRSAPLSMCLLSGPPSPRAPWLTISSCLWHSRIISVHVLLWERRNVRIIIHVTVWGRTFQHLDQQVEERVVVSDDSISDLMDGGCSNASWGQSPYRPPQRAFKSSKITISSKDGCICIEQQPLWGRLQIIFYYDCL